ncbi:MAG: hypothetical protein LC789_10010 [Actinobacteria bacterium]|nr:hypothetical protein [Actinomycetota bacterium]
MNATSSAWTAVPSLKRASRRNCTVSFAPSSETNHDRASPGTSSPVDGSMASSVSHIVRAMSVPAGSYAFDGSTDPG